MHCSPPDLWAYLQGSQQPSGDLTSLALLYVIWFPAWLVMKSIGAKQPSPFFRACFLAYGQPYKAQIPKEGRR